MALEAGENALSPYRKILLDLSSDLSKNDLEKIKFASTDIAPCGLLEKFCSGFMIFDLLEKRGKITPENLSLLEDMLETIGRADLAWKIKNFSTTTLAKVNCLSNKEASFDADEKEFHPNTDVTDGVDDNLKDHSTATKSIDELLQSRVYQPSDADEEEFYPCTDVTDGVDNNSKDHPIATKSTDDQLQSCVYQPSEATGGQCSRFQVDSSVETAHAQYVNYVALEGYCVEIVGGTHFKTPVGEFVEIKSGTQYKIHVKNLRSYGCKLDISIDGYHVGGWFLNGGQEMRIERPVSEAKKFTFYRVTKAPKEAGIESGRDENGLVKCVFTPEAFLNVPVIVDGVKQLVNIAPDATIGDLKQELSRDLDEVIAQNDVVLSNCDRLSIVRKYSGELRLIGVQSLVFDGNTKPFCNVLHQIVNCCFAWMDFNDLGAVYSVEKNPLRKSLDNESEFWREEKLTCIPAPEKLTSPRGDRSSVWKAGGTTLQGISVEPPLRAMRATKWRRSGSPSRKFAQFKASSATQEGERSSVPPYPGHSWKAGGTTLQGISIQSPLPALRITKSRRLGVVNEVNSTAEPSHATQEVPSRREQSRRFLPEADQLWKAGATTLQGHSTQDFVPAEPIQVDPSKKVILMLRLVARDDETDLIFPKDECTPLSTLYPPALPE
ncbi:uncharacterized protein [Montipora foliosa]|uniref:uncharacterized protein isoform X2 n=1 Tax=Montipora foliosa TaxID=591990 RepID=UPI0035F1722D